MKEWWEGFQRSGLAAFVFGKKLKGLKEEIKKVEQVFSWQCQGEKIKMLEEDRRIGQKRKYQNISTEERAVREEDKAEYQ